MSVTFNSFAGSKMGAFVESQMHARNTESYNIPYDTFVLFALTYDVDDGGVTIGTYPPTQADFNNAWTDLVAVTAQIGATDKIIPVVGYDWGYYVALNETDNRYWFNAWGAAGYADTSDLATVTRAKLTITLTNDAANDWTSPIEVQVRYGKTAPVSTKIEALATYGSDGGTITVAGGSETKVINIPVASIDVGVGGKFYVALFPSYNTKPSYPGTTGNRMLIVPTLRLDVAGTLD